MNEKCNELLSMNNHSMDADNDFVLYDYWVQ